MINLETFAVINLNSALDLIMDTLQPDNNNNDEELDDMEYKMYDEELEVLIISFIDDIFELIVTVVEDVSVKAYDKMMATRKKMTNSVRTQVGSKLIIACSLLLSFLSIWINLLELSGMRAGKLHASMKITMKLIKTLESANVRFTKNRKAAAKEKAFQRSKSMWR